MRATEDGQPPISRSDFGSRADLAVALADKVADALAEAIERRGQAILAVSGGTTPKAFFAALSQRPIDWGKVTVTLVDERLVGPDHERSNQRLASRHLLQNHAADAAFVPLYLKGETATQIAAQASQRIDELGLPIDVMVLGMGADGHTASFFPGGTTLDQVTDPACPHSVMAIEAPNAGEPRLTLTLPRIVEAGLLVLHIEGDAKAAVLALALQAGPEADMPVRAVLRHASSPVDVYWAP